MRKRGGITLAVAALTIAACSAEPTDQIKASGEVAALTEADIVGVKSTVDAYVRTSLAQDWIGFSNTLAPEVIAYPPNTGPLKGREAVLEFVKAFPKILTFTVDVAEVVGRGDFAVATGTYHLTFQNPDGSTGKDDGSFIEVHERGSDGSWPYKRLIWHSDLPAPAAAPAK
jgi:ketosteroid isomerase-like protein